MPTLLGRLILFLSAYSPLLLLFAILDSFGAGAPSIICAAVAVVSVVGLVLFWTTTRHSATDLLHLRTTKGRDSDVLSFFVTYVVPFAAAQDANNKTRVALAFFAVVIAVLYLRSAVFYIHPLLLLAGWHVFEATTTEDTPIVLLTRQQHLRQDCVSRAVRVAPAVYWERGV